jgi:hypothetical protein
VTPPTGGGLTPIGRSPGALTPAASSSSARRAGPGRGVIDSAQRKLKFDVVATPSTGTLAAAAALSLENPTQARRPSASAVGPAVAAPTPLGTPGAGPIDSVPAPPMTYASLMSTKTALLEAYDHRLLDPRRHLPPPPVGQLHVIESFFPFHIVVRADGIPPFVRSSDSGSMVSEYGPVYAFFTYPDMERLGNWKKGPTIGGAKSYLLKFKQGVANREHCVTKVAVLRKGKEGAVSPARMQHRRSRDDSGRQTARRTQAARWDRT